MKVLALFTSRPPYDQAHYSYLKATLLKLDVQSLTFLNSYLVTLAPHLYGPKKGEPQKPLA